MRLAKGTQAPPSADPRRDVRQKGPADRLGLKTARGRALFRRPRPRAPAAGAAASGVDASGASDQVGRRMRRVLII
jgi:hypothetical protein